MSDVVDVKGGRAVIEPRMQNMKIPSDRVHVLFSPVERWVGRRVPSWSGGLVVLVVLVVVADASHESLPSQKVLEGDRISYRS